MKIAKHSIFFDDNTEVRFVIVDKTTGEVHEPVMRCLGNFKNYVVVGTIIVKDDYETYALIETENIKHTSLTITRNDNAEPLFKDFVLLNYSQKELKGEIIKRAKDLIFNF